MDFTLDIYKILLNRLQCRGYSFMTFAQFTESKSTKIKKKEESKSISKHYDSINMGLLNHKLICLILRHDVDARKYNSLKFAHIQHEMGIVGTYYFRMIPQSFDPKVVKEIATMGHEIGYHYEDMDFANGDPHKAIKLFEKHLSQLREVAEVKTICMHGSPLSKYDNRAVWEHYDYRDYGIIAEPYFDLDFSKVLYLTDTGRRWDGDKVSMRDRSADDSINPAMKDKKPLSDQYSFRSTHDIIKACEEGKLPDKIMFNFHPQRWTNNSVLWTQELVMQNAKNVAKRVLRSLRSR